MKIAKLEVTSNIQSKRIVEIGRWHKRKKKLPFCKCKFFQRKIRKVLIILLLLTIIIIFYDGTSGKESACQCRRHKRCRSNPCFKKIPWKEMARHTSVFLLIKSHGQRNLAGYIPWDHKELDPTE